MRTYRVAGASGMARVSLRAIRARATELFPFAIAVALPPAGFILGIGYYTQDDRDLGLRLMLVAALAAVCWVLLLTL